MRLWFWLRALGFLVAVLALVVAGKVKDSLGVEVSGVAGFMLALLATGVVAWRRGRW